MTPELIRNVVVSRKLYRKPGAVNPMILARIAKLLARPCTAP
jgi:hypothetical protein